MGYIDPNPDGAKPQSAEPTTVGGTGGTVRHVVDRPTGIQRLVLRLLPRRMAARAAQESKEWVAVCGACGHATSWWEMGGIRFGAASKGKRTRRRCAACGETGWQRVERRA